VPQKKPLAEEMSLSLKDNRKERGAREEREEAKPVVA
jgi:hypothetical protein